ncbi:hypothetical protein FDA33_02755 [Clostridium botulinum]|nr:hypothetical protein [Clostridium botulinum]NFI17066.1 hypothetical protein [Clostridium botulinum]NFL92000.1 hypothetical protein [Clostridium botulinum]NFN51269.1 hypothetical protein [Clostridium botulinum]NFO26478.1 hypothetical protein [Clostridium botulinum]
MLSKLKKFRNLLTKYDFNILSDTLDKIEISYTYASSYNQTYFVDFLIDLFNMYPNSIRIKSPATYPPFKFVTNVDELKDKLLSHLDKHLHLQTKDIIYILTISKNTLIQSQALQNFICFFSIESFIKILKNPIDNIQLLSRIFTPYKSNIILLINTDDIYLKNSTTIISSVSYPDESEILNFNSTLENLKNKIDTRKECCNIEFLIMDIIPDYFIFDFNNILFGFTSEFKMLLNNLFTLFFMLYLGNYSSLSNDNIIIKICSNKNLEFEYNLNLLNTDLIDYIYLIQIYYLAYNSLNIQNIYLVRNILCIHIFENNINIFFSKSKDILESAKENLNILSIQNVEKYFSVRYGLYDFIDKSTLSIENKISELIQKLNKIFLSCIATLIGVSFVYLKDRNFLILRFSIIIYTLYLFLDCLFSFISIRLSYNTNNEKYKAKLEYFKPIIGIDHYNKIIDTDSTKKIKTKFNIYFFIILFIYSIMILAGFWSFSNTNEVINWIKYTLL